MEVAFYRCYVCQRLCEKQEMMRRIEKTLFKGCVCGSRKFKPVEATKAELFWFVVKHPRYIVDALFGGSNV